MNDFEHARYCMWQLELWGRNYGPTSQIDRDVNDGKLVPGTMPDAFWREGDGWRKQSEVERLIKGGRP